MPLVHWVSGFDEAADAVRQLDENNPHFWTSGMGPPCGISVSFSSDDNVANANGSSNVASEGMRRFAAALDRGRSSEFGGGGGAGMVSRQQRRRRMWLELRGATFVIRNSSSNGDDDGDDDGDADDDSIIIGTAARRRRRRSRNFHSDTHQHHRNEEEHENDDDDDDSTPDDAQQLRRLFGASIPHHPCLEEVRIVRCNFAHANNCTLGALCRALTAATTATTKGTPSPGANASADESMRNQSSSSLPLLHRAPTAPASSPRSSSLRSLHLNGAALGPHGLASIVRLLESNAAGALESLAVVDCDFAAADHTACDGILRALQNNTHLVSVRLLFAGEGGGGCDGGGPVSGEAVRALGTSKVRRLRLRNPHASTLPAIVSGLASNRVLEELHLSVQFDHNGERIGSVEQHLHEYATGNSRTRRTVLQFQQLLRTCNFALRELRLYHDSFVWLYPKDQGLFLDPWLRHHNAVVRQAYGGLVGRNFRIQELALWGRALAKVSSKPALLYQFVRVGNLDLLERHLANHPPHKLQEQTPAPAQDDDDDGADNDEGADDDQNQDDDDQDQVYDDVIFL
jgi:hypothetical protein